MKQLFGDQELALDIEKIKKTLVRNMLQVHIASVERRLEACKRCPLITENPGGFKAQRSIDPVIKDRLQNYTHLHKGYPIAMYEPLKEKVDPTPDPDPKTDRDKEVWEGNQDEKRIIKEFLRQIAATRHASLYDEQPQGKTREELSKQRLEEEEAARRSRITHYEEQQRRDLSSSSDEIVPRPTGTQVPHTPTPVRGGRHLGGFRNLAGYSNVSAELQKRIDANEQERTLLAQTLEDLAGKIASLKTTQFQEMGHDQYERFQKELAAAIAEQELVNTKYMALGAETVEMRKKQKEAQQTGETLTLHNRENDRQPSGNTDGDPNRSSENIATTGTVRPFTFIAPPGPGSERPSRLRSRSASVHDTDASESAHILGTEVTDPAKKLRPAQPPHQVSSGAPVPPPPNADGIISPTIDSLTTAIANLTDADLERPPMTPSSASFVDRSFDAFPPAPPPGPQGASVPVPVGGDDPAPDDTGEDEKRETVPATRVEERPRPERTLVFPQAPTYNPNRDKDEEGKKKKRSDFSGPLMYVAYDEYWPFELNEQEGKDPLIVFPPPNARIAEDRVPIGVLRCMQFPGPDNIKAGVEIENENNRRKRLHIRLLDEKDKDKDGNVVMDQGGYEDLWKKLAVFDKQRGPIEMKTHIEQIMHGPSTRRVTVEGNPFDWSLGNEIVLRDVVSQLCFAMKFTTPDRSQPDNEKYQADYWDAMAGRIYSDNKLGAITFADNQDAIEKKSFKTVFANRAARLATVQTLARNMAARVMTRELSATQQNYSVKYFEMCYAGAIAAVIRRFNRLDRQNRQYLESGGSGASKWKEHLKKVKQNIIDTAPNMTFKVLWKKP